MGTRNNSIIISAVLVAFLVGTIFSSPNYANALPPWANDLLVRIGLLETTTIDLQTQIDNIKNSDDSYYVVVETITPQEAVILCEEGDVMIGMLSDNVGETFVQESLYFASQDELPIQSTTFENPRGVFIEASIAEMVVSILCQDLTP